MTICKAATSAAIFRSGRNLVFLILLLILGNDVLANGTLSGTITDAADGETAVHPVLVTLLDPVSGDFLPHSAQADASGNWVIADIPPGQYKVLFMAYGASERYLDELHGDVWCDNTGCDRAALGSTYTILDGQNSLDNQLSAGYLISGTITRPDGDPLLGAYVDVFDNAGNYICCANEIDENGFWDHVVPDNGNYFVITPPWSTPGHVPEVWEDTPCNECDVSGLGSPVSINNADVGGIDFELDAVPGLATLEGTVVDAGDGVTPIEFVRVELIDPETGNILTQYGVYTNAAGFYQVNGIPIGNYKVHFDGDSWSEVYLDELYDNEICVNKNCDLAAQGNVFAVKEGVNSLDVDLIRGMTISGRVVDEDDNPLEGFLVEIYDSDGELYNKGYVYSAGIWGVPVQQNGEYFALISHKHEHQTGYKPQVFNGKDCENCDPTTAGDPITVSGGDVGNIDFVMTRIAETGSISGTVTDSTTGLGVLPQARLHALDGTIVTVVNGASDGTYTLDNIEPGSYYVLLNNYDGDLIDELYDDIKCPRLSCDTNGGTHVTVSAGGSTSGIDAALDPGSQISGTVLVDGAPVESIGIAVTLSDGRHAGYGETDQNGQYRIRSGLPAGSYYVRLAPDQGYDPVVYPDRLCGESCDVTLGDLVTVDGIIDVGEINFNVATFSSSGACGTSDLIMASSFEPIPEYSINFISDANTVFSESGQQTTFSVEYLDELGNPLDTSRLEWCLEDGSILDITPAGSSATVSSTGFEIGSVNLSVRDPNTSIRADATIMFADMQPEAIYIDSDWVAELDRDIGHLVLVRNDQTEQIQPGDVLISGDKAGVLVRVLTVNLTPDQVILTVESAKITDAFLNLNSKSSSSRQSIDVQYDSSTRQLNMAIQVDNRNVSMQSAIIDELECKQENGSAFGLSIEGADIDWHLDIKLDGDLKINNGGVEEFYVLSRQTMTIVPTTGSLNFSSQLAGKVTCELPLEKWESPTVPVSVFSVGMAIQPKVGVEVSGSISGPSFSIAGPSGRLVDTTTSGIRYTPVAGWEPIRSSNHKVSASLFDAEFNTDIEFNLDAQAYGGASLQMVTNLGKGIFSYELAAVEFIELRGGVSLHGELTTPFEPTHMDYTGPKWDLSGVITGKFKAELAGGALDDLLRKVDVPVTISVGGNIMEPIKETLLSSPRLKNASIDCTQPECYLDQELSDHASLIISTDGDRNGSVTWLGAPDDWFDDYLLELTSGPLTHSSSLAEWHPDSSFPYGKYVAQARLRTDALSGILPYTLDLGALPEMVVTRTFSIEVQKVDLADGQPITGGRIFSEPEGLDCGEDCTSRFPAYWDIKLKAEPEGQYHFVQWAWEDDNGVCVGSTDPNCEIWLSREVMRPKAIFAKLTSVQIDPLGIGSGIVVSEPEGIECPGEACTALLPTGEYLKLTATPDSGSYFYKWKGQCGYANPCYFTLSDSSYVLEPIFTKLLSDISFADPALESCVLNAEKDLGGTVEYVDDVTRLYCEDLGITNLSGIEQLTSLSSLSLPRNSVTNLAPLVSMTQLEYLYLEENGLSDVSALEDLIRLKRLNLRFNNLTNISSLSNMVDLEHLDIAHNNIVNISAFSSATKLEVFRFEGNEVTNIEVLAYMPDLNTLELYGNQISDLSVFSTFVPKSGSSLTSLNLSHNQITDASPLRNWTELQYLDLENNKLSHLGDLSNMDSLRILNLRRNELVDVSGLAGMNAIETIALQNNSVNHLGDLSSLDTLIELNLDYNQVSDVSGLEGLDSLEALSLDDSPLVNVTPLSGLTTLKTLSLWRTLVSNVSSLTSLTNLENLTLSWNEGRISCAQQASFPWVQNLYVDGWYDADGDGNRDSNEDC